MRRHIKNESHIERAARLLAEWIVSSHGEQDWDVKVEECSEPAAAALGVPYEAFRVLVAEIVDTHREAAK